MQMTIDQCTQWKAKDAFTILARKTSNYRASQVSIVKGDVFWVTNSKTNQIHVKGVLLDRKGKGTISSGYLFTFEQLHLYFELVK